MSIAHEVEPEKTQVALWNVGLGSALRRELSGLQVGSCNFAVCGSVDRIPVSLTADGSREAD